jgi:threonine 3-dehydrogenase
MSGSGEAFKDMLANMCHGAKTALLGIPSVIWRLTGTP